MKIQVTAAEVLDSNLVGAWDKFCDMKGLNPWAINEGMMDRDEVFYITLEEAKELNLIERGTNA